MTRSVSSDLSVDPSMSENESVDLSSGESPSISGNESIIYDLTTDEIEDSEDSAAQKVLGLLSLKVNVKKFQTEIIKFLDGITLAKNGPLLDLYFCYFLSKITKDSLDWEDDGGEAVSIYFDTAFVRPDMMIRDFCNLLCVLSGNNVLFLSSNEKLSFSVNKEAMKKAPWLIFQQDIMTRMKIHPSSGILSDTQRKDLLRGVDTLVIQEDLPGHVRLIKEFLLNKTKEKTADIMNWLSYNNETYEGILAQIVETSSEEDPLFGQIEQKYKSGEYTPPKKRDGNQ